MPHNAITCIRVLICCWLMTFCLPLLADNQTAASTSSYDVMQSIIDQADVSHWDDSLFDASDRYTTITSPDITQRRVREGQLSFAYFTLPIQLSSTPLRAQLTGAWSVFASPFTSYYAVLTQGGSLNNSQFKQGIVFHQLTAQGPMDFTQSSFMKKADFFGSTWLSSVRFEGAHFHEAADFRETEFDAMVDFSHAVFDGTLALNNGLFLSGLDLSGVTAHTIDLNHVSMSGYLNLQGIQLGDKLNLNHITPAQAGEKIAINLLGVDLSHLNLSYDHFVLSFPKNTSESEKDHLYRALLDKFKGDGHMKSHDALYREFSEHQYRAKHAYIRLFFSKTLWSFGTEKNKIFVLLACLFGLFTLVNAIFYRRLLDHYIEIEFLSQMDYTQAELLSYFQRFFYYLPYALMMTFSLSVCLFLPAMGIGTKNLRGKSIAVTSYLMLMPVVGFMLLTFILIFILRA